MRHLPLVFALCVTGVSSAHAGAPVFRKVTKQELPVAIKPSGTLVNAVAWSDAAGHNVAAFFRSINTKKNTARLEVKLWSGTPGTKGVVVRTVKDGVPVCEGDLHAAFIDEALAVTDLDADGYGELTFAYRMTCTSDVSPFLLKLLMLERRDKYGIRGSTLMDLGGGQQEGGDKKPDAALTAIPAFAQHADKVWSAIVKCDERCWSQD